MRGSSRDRRWYFRTLASWLADVAVAATPPLTVLWSTRLPVISTSMEMTLGISLAGSDDTRVLGKS